MKHLFMLLVLCMPALAVTEIWGNTPDADHRQAVQDTYLSNNDENYHLEDELKAHTYPANTPANVILMKWDLSMLSGAQIKSAKLQLYLFEPSTDIIDDSYDISVHRVRNKEPVFAKVTGRVVDGDNEWSGHGYSLGLMDTSSAEDSIPVDKYPGYKEWDVSSMVQYWADNPQENFGMLLRPDPSASLGANRVFASSEHSSANWRPRLEVSYTDSVSIADILSMVISWKNGLTPLAELNTMISRW